MRRRTMDPEQRTRDAEQSEALRKAKHFFRLGVTGQAPAYGLPSTARALLLAAQHLAAARALDVPEDDLLFMDEDFAAQLDRSELPVWQAISTAIEVLSRHVEPSQPARLVPR